jgi:hypothetical protein
MMPATNPRIFTVLEKPVFRAVEGLAKRDGVSLSQKARDLIVQALELSEDAGIESIVDSRRKNRAKAIPLENFLERYNVK